jgi:hypothetical protein
MTDRKREQSNSSYNSSDSSSLGNHRSSDDEVTSENETSDDCSYHNDDVNASELKTHFNLHGSIMKKENDDDAHLFA